jgi:hypothetical protein
MKLISVLALAVALSGCATMTPRQKDIAIAVGTAVVIGSVAAATHGNSHHGNSGKCLIGEPIVVIGNLPASVVCQ